MNQAPIPFALPDIDEQEFLAVRQVLTGNWLTTGPATRRFEHEFAAFVGAPYAVATASCTAALHLALAGLVPEPGDIMISSPYTFAAAPEVAQHLGMIPVFVDIDPLTLNLDPEKLRETLMGLSKEGRRVAAVVPVHLAGTPCEMDAIDALADEFGFSIVEDAAHALPSTYHGRIIGAPRPSGHPFAVCYSFYANKTITTGEGGMLVTDHESRAEHCRKLSLHGIDKTSWSRGNNLHHRQPWFYDIEHLGFKYNMSDMAAAMGLVQLGKLPAMTARRREIAACYDRFLSSYPELQIPSVPKSSETSRHLYILRICPEYFQDPASARDDLSESLRRRGITTSVHYRPLHLHRYYRETFGFRPDYFPVSVREYRRALSLPIFSRMNEAEVERVLDGVRHWLGRAAIRTVKRRQADKSRV